MVYLANSMAVRDLDTFSQFGSGAFPVLVNRGAAGIDGTISSALGASRAWIAEAKYKRRKARVPQPRSTILLSGDLAFLHDLNGLGADLAGEVDLTIIVLNDGGGGIFRMLPIAEAEPGLFERYFQTPPRADIAAACATYGVAHRLVENREELSAALDASLGEPGIQVLEIPIDPEINMRVHREHWARVAERLRA